ncbi:unnamed protein product [Tenebrio molitor]|nr:unnamed protein product [Tenebrio molitor]
MMRFANFSEMPTQIFASINYSHLVYLPNKYICHSRCFGIRGGHGKSAFKLAVKLSVEFGDVFLSLRL